MSFERRRNRRPAPLPTLVESKVSRSVRIVAMQLLLALIWTRMMTCIMMAFSMACISHLVWALRGHHVRYSSVHVAAPCFTVAFIPTPPIVRFTRFPKGLEPEPLFGCLIPWSMDISSPAHIEVQAPNCLLSTIICLANYLL